MVVRVDSLLLNKQTLNKQAVEAITAQQKYPHFAANTSRRLNHQAMKKAAYHTATDTFGQPQILMNANPTAANFGMNRKEFLKNLFAVGLGAVALGVTGCQKEDPIEPTEVGTVTGELNNFINVSPTTWSFHELGVNPETGNSICEISMPLKQGVSVNNPYGTDVGINIFNGETASNHVMPAVEISDMKNSEGNAVFTYQGPLTEGTKFTFAPGTFMKEDVENDGTVITVGQGAGVAHPTAGTLAYKGLDYGSNARSRMVIGVYSSGIDLDALGFTDRALVNYDSYGTDAQKITAAKTAVTTYMKEQMGEDTFNNNPKYAQYVNLLDDADFRALSEEGLHALTGYFSLLDGTEQGERMFNYFTMHDENGLLPASSPKANDYGAPYTMVGVDNPGALPSSAFAEMTHPISGPLLYLQDNNGIFNYRRWSMDDFKHVLGHEITHGRNEGTAFNTPPSQNEEIIAFLFSVYRYIKNDLSSTVAKAPSQQGMFETKRFEQLAILFSNSGPNGKPGILFNPRVVNTNGNKPWPGGNKTTQDVTVDLNGDGSVNNQADKDIQLSFERVRLGYQNDGREGGFVSKFMATAISDMTNGQVTPQAGDNYTDELMNDINKHLSFSTAEITQVLSALQSKPIQSN